MGTGAPHLSTVQACVARSKSMRSWIMACVSTKDVAAHASDGSS